MSANVVPTPTTDKSLLAIDVTPFPTVVSKIKSFRKPEPYKGKGIREQGQRILRKELQGLLIIVCGKDG